MKKTIITLALMLSLTACNETHQDAQTATTEEGGLDIDYSPARVVAFNDGFRNVAFKCDGTYGLYVTSSGEDSLYASSIAVIENHTDCTENRD